MSRKLPAICWAWLAVAVVAVGAAARGEEMIQIIPREGITNFFGGQEIELHFDLVSAEAYKGQARWALSSGQRTIASREVDVELAPGKSFELAVRHKLAPLKEGVVFPLGLRISVGAAKGERPVAEFEDPIFLFAENPFLDRHKWLESLKLHVFDPEEATTKALDDLKVPYTRITNLETLADMEQGLVIIGEGTTWTDYGDLGKSLVAAAERGVSVVVLPPSAAKLTATSFLTEPAARVTLRRRDVIRELDKRFSLAWQVDRAVETSDLVFEVENGEVTARAGEPGKGWPWVEVHFRKPNARFIWCGFGLRSSWEKSPTPRYLLARLFEILTPEEPLPVEDTQ